MPLIDPYLKTTRARIHLENLRDQLAAFLQQPCDFSREDDLANQLHIIRMKVRNIPDDIPLIAGDLLCCLRGSLDQLVWCLAKINATPGYPERTQFPIFEQRDAARFARYTNGVPTEAVAMIEALQPYNAPAGAVHEHLLWRLNKLCNIDKHMRIPVHGVTGIVRWETFVPFSAKTATLSEFDNEGVLKIPLAMKNQVFNPSIPEFKVLFGDLYWGIQCDFAGIDAIYEFVANSVLPRFARFFT
jgi:hypothetical protein